MPGQIRETVGKANVIGTISRSTDKIALPVILCARRKTLRAFIDEIPLQSVILYTDECKGNADLDRKANRKLKTLRHSKGDYVYGSAGTTCIPPGKDR